MSTNEVALKQKRTFKQFLKDKDVEFSAKRYLQDALSMMAQGLFASLLIGLIIKTIGQQSINLWGDNSISEFLITVGQKAMDYMGAAVGVAVAWGLKAPPLVIFSSTVTGMIGAELGGPAGAFIGVAIGVELGKMVSKETKIDILITPLVTILAGAISGKFIGAFIGKCMTWLGDVLIAATDWQPFLFGIFISVVVGLVLTAPISSAALCIMMDISGLAAGAATAGCCAQMVGFAVISLKENGVGGLVAQGIGTSMLQVPNIIKNPWTLVPPTLAAAITGPIATCVLGMTNNAMGAGMGTSGLVGQIGTFTAMGFTLPVLVKVLVVQIVLPAILAITFDRLLKKAGKIKLGDYKLDL